MKVQTDFRVLMQKAYTLGQANLSGDPERMRVAKADHDDYRELCLQATIMTLGCTYGALDSPSKH